MLKKMSLFTAVAGLVIVLAPAAQAESITIDNFSFETVVDGGNDPEDWVVVESDNWVVQTEGRPAYAGPTDGDAIMYLEHRGGGKNGTASQDIGTVADHAGFSQFVMTFDARLGNFVGTGDGSMRDRENEANSFYAYFTVNGVKDTGGDFETNIGPDRLLKTATEIQAMPGHETDQMLPYTATLDTTGLIGTDVLGITFEYDTPNGGNAYHSRVCMDNVRVDAVPEPGTTVMLLGALAGLALFVRRRRRAL